MLTLPKILHIQKKLMPLILEFNYYAYFLLTGGRGGGKSQAIARYIIYMCDKRVVRVVCGRETMKSIDGSVYTILCDLIREHDLTDFIIQSNKILHKNGSEINFMGFREQGRANIKGLEGVDILWIDEAEVITKATLDIILPTIRKDGSKVIFSMNRNTRHDPVFVAFDQRDDCLSIKINYNENEFCPKKLIDEAMQCKLINEDDYRHIWLGEPLVQGENVLFNSSDLDNCKKVQFFGNSYPQHKVLAVDVANGGGDLSVAGVLHWITPHRFELAHVESWNSKNLMETTGRIIEIKRQHNVDVIVVDANGIGEGAYDRLCELDMSVEDFKGSRSSEVAEAYNTRADAFIRTRDLIQQGKLKITNDRVLADLEAIKFKPHSSGKKLIMSKADIKKDIQRSPDFADMISMAVWGLDKIELQGYNSLQTHYNIED